MRIAMITGEYPPLEGGVGDFTRELSRALVVQGQEVHILTTHAREAPPRLDEPGGRGSRATVAHEGALTVYRQIREWGLRSYTYITDWITKLAPEVVNLQYQSAAYHLKAAINFYPRWCELFARRHTVPPIVVTYHDLMPPYLFPKAGSLRAWSVRQLAYRSQGVIVTNDEDYTALTAHRAKDKLPPVRLIPIGSNIAPNPPPDYDRETWRAAHGYEAHTLVVGFFGFLNRSKGVETLLQAVAQLAGDALPIQLLFVGGRTGSSDSTNAAYAREIDRLIENLALTERVQYTGFVAPSEISAALLSTDICALPYRDGVNLRRGTLHACLAHGCPIVTTTPEKPVTDFGSYSGLEGESIAQSVCLVPAEHSQALAEAIRRLWGSPALRERLGQNAVTLAQSFSWDRIAAQTMYFFQQLQGMADNGQGVGAA
jgi:glycosyltransferase involved in cell wall biosynthesis